MVEFHPEAMFTPDDMCVLCGNSVHGFFFPFIKNKFYVIYPGHEKGAFEITKPKPICEKCLQLKTPSELDKKRFANFENFFEKGQYHEALMAINSGFNRNNEYDWLCKGNSFQNLEKYDEALDCYNEALYLNTHLAIAWYRKGMILLKKNEIEKANLCFLCLHAADRQWFPLAAFGIFITTKNYEDYNTGKVLLNIFLPKIGIELGNISHQELVDYSIRHAKEIFEKLEIGLCR